MASAAAPASENAEKRADLNSKPPETEDATSTQAQVPSGGVGDESKGKSPALSGGANDDGGGAVTDVQKKMKRAERFGMPVQLSEEERRNTRAQRFGTGSAANGLDSSKPSEELKRKARAERFGIVQSDPSDEEAKKKARLARFGSFSKTDSAEEDKKKARAIRFSQKDSITKGNAKGNIDLNTTIAGKAGGGT